MKKLSFVFAGLLSMIILYISSKPIHIPKELISYWPLILGCLLFILFIIFILFLIKRIYYKNETMPKGEILVGILFMLIGTGIFTFVFLH